MPQIPVVKKIGTREYQLLPFGFDEWAALTSELATVSSPAAGLVATVLGPILEKKGVHIGASGGALDVGESVQRVAFALLGSARGGLLDRLCAHLSVNQGTAGRDVWESMRTAKARDLWAGEYFEGCACVAWVLEVAFVGFWTAAIAAWPELGSALDELGAKKTEEKKG